MKPYDITVAFSGEKKIVNNQNEQFSVAQVEMFGAAMLFARANNGSTGPVSMSVEGLLSNGTQLYIAGEKYIKYMNIYPALDGTFISGKVLHESEAAAREVAGGTLVAVARVEFED